MGQFLAGLGASVDLPSRTPLDRWDADEMLSVGPQLDKIYAALAATFDSSVAIFDTTMFAMSRAEAAATDAQVS